MSENKVLELRGTDSVSDGLTELLRSGARKLIKDAVELELQEFLAAYAAELTGDGKKRIVRNGYLPERAVQTALGSIPVEMPRTRDRSGLGVKFSSKLLPPYLRRTRSIEELLPWLYLKGISSNDFGEALEKLLGPGAAGLSPSTICRLKSGWESECDKWRQSSLASRRYVYMWVDGIHCGVRGSDDKLCILVAIGVTETGVKELIALDEGYRESTETWLTLLRDMRSRGMEAPQLAVGDGALGFWNALAEVFPQTRTQRCWQHKCMNVLNRLPKSLQDKGRSMLQDIWMADTRENADKAWSAFEKTFGEKYPKAVENLAKDKQALLTFFDFPAEHWASLRTTNPIESTFATVRHRASQTKGCVSRATMLALVFKLVQSAQKRWHRLRGFSRLGEVIEGVKFVNGVATTEEKKTDEDDGNNAQRIAA